MKEYFRYFRIPFIAFAVVLLIAGIASFGRKTVADERNNDECTTEERVFDYADRLTDEEEDNLREQIAKTEKKIEADIVIVTLNESLEDYALAYDSNADMDEYVMIYADNFYDEHKFGYDEPIGDGVLFLDNIGEEADGVKYVAISTSGKVEQKYSNSMLVRLRDDALKYIDVHPYRAYSDFVKQVEKDLSSSIVPGMENLAKPHIALIAAAVVTAIFLLINLSGRKGKKTTTAHSYVNGGQPMLRGREDRFLHKHVTSRVIETSSGGGGGGGGGHHTSSGGASHGGITGGR